MAYYLVRATLLEKKQSELKKRLESGEVFNMQPFGKALDYSLKNARVTSDNSWIWEEEDYCNPPLAMERAALLDDYFTNLSTEKIEKSKGWKQIEQLSRGWQMIDIAPRLK
jgi:hypothetical protein